VPELQDGGLVGHTRCTFQADEAAVQRPLVQLLFRGRITEVPPELQAVDAQHGLDGERRPTAQRLVRTSGMEPDHVYQRGPGHDLVHLFEEDLLASLLGQRLQAERHLIHAQHRPTASSRVPVGMTRGFADCP
jgi:hypothetical protein